MLENDILWIPFYHELAGKLIAYKDNRQALLKQLHEIFQHIGMPSPFVEKAEPMTDVDPFSVFGCFNKGLTNANRTKILTGFARQFNLKATVPTNFDGIPTLNNLKAFFFAFRDHPKRGERDIDNLWELFLASLRYADNPTEEAKASFVKIFDVVKGQIAIRWNITMGLYWIRPYSYINLDDRNRQYLGMGKVFPPVDMLVAGMAKKVPSGAEYLEIIERCKDAMEHEHAAVKSFVELSHSAWLVTSGSSADSGYWPPLKDYNPGITKEMWLSILQDKSVTTADALQLLNMFLQLGGESTFNNLVEKFGNQFYYKGTLQEFSSRVFKKVNCAPCPKEYEKFTQYIIPFVGRMAFEDNVKRESWKLRNELKAALEQLGFWPSLAEYDPKLTKEDWKKYILEVELPNHPQPMQMLKALMEQNGQASCKRLSELYGGTPSRYVGCTTSLGRRAKKYFNLPACMDEGQERFFAIPFVGKRMLESDKEYYVYRMRPELFAALKEIDLSGVSLYVTGEEETMDTLTDVGLNTILYGPPGTGKTYHTAIYAVAIIENKELESVKAEAYQDVLNRYNEYKAQGRIEFTTFHQSYGYEEFIEGIRPSVVDEGDEDEAGNIQYSVQPGMFKKFCEKAARPITTSTSTGDLGIGENATVWKVSLWGTGDNEVRTECLANGHIRIGWDQYGKDITDGTDFSVDGGRVVLNAFINKMQIGDIVFSCYSASTIDAIGVVTGEYEWHDEYDELKRVRKVNWIVKGIRENILALNGGTSMTLASVYRLSNIAISDVYKLIEKHQPAKAIVSSRKENYVFIIDEINRGNISKIFGELITLIEESKRVGKEEGMKTLLPYSMKPFGVPENVYIIGTMNTADRSIAAIDTALRRRFEFKEMLPNPEVVAKISVGNLSIKTMLEKMNRRIAVLYDREHTIGHAYFMPLAKDNSTKKLAEIFKNKVIPLLQEYFYEDYEKIRLVLADNQKKDERDQFILAKKINQGELFGSADIGLDDGFTYEINEDAFMNPEAYLQI